MATAMRANRSGAPGTLNSTPGPRSRPVRSPWGTSWTPPADWLMAWAAPAESVPYESPARYAARLMWYRASRFEPSSYATRSHLDTYSMAWSATASVNGWWYSIVKHSTAWASASMPVPAVTDLGSFTVSAGSISATHAAMFGVPPTLNLILRSGSVMTAH